MKRLIILITIISLGSCKKELSDNSAGIPEYIKWEVVLPQEDNFTTIYDAIIFEDLAIFPLQDQGILLALDKESGEEVWRWTEARETYPGADGFGRVNYVYENVMIMGQRNILYALDLVTGQTIWHQKNDLQSLNNFKGYDNIVGINFRVPNESVSYMSMDITSGEREPVVEFNKDDQYHMSGNSPVVHYYKGEMHMTLVQKKWLSSIDGYEEYGWMHHYNLNDNELVWTTDTIPKNSPILHVPGSPLIYEDKILLVSNSIQCYDIETGELLWIDQSHTNTFTWSTGLTISHDKVFGNNENGYMIALDVETGSELWRTDTGGTGSRIEYYDEKVYINEITRAGMSYLMVLDANTGEILHDIPSPYEIFGENNWYWDDVITVDQETGLIYTADHNKVMCIELDD